MSDEVNQLVEAVLEADDFDTKEVSGEPLDAALSAAGFATEEGVWIKRMANEAVTVARIPNDFYSIGFHKRGQTGWIPDHRTEGGENAVRRMLRDYAAVPVQESEDFDTKEVAGDMTLDFLKRYGFRQSTLAPFPWEKRMGKLAVSIEGFGERQFAVRFWDLVDNAWKCVSKQDVDENGLIEVLNELGEKPVKEGMEDDFDSKEVYAGDYLDDIGNYVERGILSLYGNVKRTDHHYVHERSTTFTLRDEWYWTDEIPRDEQQEIELRIGKLLDRLEKDIDERMVDWNRKIYKELEAAYDWSVSEEVVAETIESNDYRFSEDGEYDEGNLLYSQLNDRAKQKAREWWVQGEDAMGQNYYAEPVVAEWKWLLKNKGFDDADISWSGFSSQGDGASFTADSFDFTRFKKFPDPLEFPETDREQIDEAVEDSDFKDVLGEPPPAETFKVMSSLGEFVVRVEDGQVLKTEIYPPVDADGENLKNIDRFDVNEWRSYWKEDIKPGTDLDILDFGCWNKNGSYEPPVAEFRRDCLFYGEENNPVHESEEDEAQDAKDVYGTNRQSLKHIDNAHDYAEFEARFQEFMEREGINNLSTGDELGFSWTPCDCCHRALGGERYYADGFNPTTREVQDYKICSDCMYYANYGALDDMTMMKIGDSKKELGLGESEDDDFKEVHGTPPPDAVFTITSSWGELTARTDDGMVLSVTLKDPPPAPPEEDTLPLSQIAKFDLGEWRRYYPNRVIEDGDRVDILDLGFWDKDNDYIPPDEGYREIRREMGWDED